MKLKEIVQTSDAPAAVGPYSQAIKLGDILYTSGQIPLDPKSGEVVSNKIEEQAEQVLKNLGAVLREAGLDYASVVKTTIFLTDLGAFKAVNEIYAKYFGDSLPARSTVQVAALPLGVQIEIEAVAAS